MNIIVGATGQVGSHIVNELHRSGIPVRAVVRNAGKMSNKSVETRTADLFNADELIAAFEGGTTVFVITPEDPKADDIIGDTKRIVNNYQEAIQATGIKTVIGLSCVGAHVDGDTGNVLMSRMLEQGLDELNARKVFIRPSYYYSNWLLYRDAVEKSGLLPTFFPQGLAIEMHSPLDLAKFVAEMMMDEEKLDEREVFELVGPKKYSPAEVARSFSNLLNKTVQCEEVPKDQWKGTLLSGGFTDNTALNLMKMTQAVNDNKTIPERPEDVIKLPSTFETYLKDVGEVFRNFL